MKSACKFIKILFLGGTVLVSSCGGPLQYTKNGDNYYASGNYKSAAEQYRKNIQYYESINYPLYMLNLAAADYRAGRLEESRRAFFVALKLSHGENLNAVEKNFGFLAPKSESSYKLKDYEEIIVHFYLGLIYVRTGEPDEALVEFKKINLIDPEYPLVHFIMGSIYQMKGDGEEAEIEFRLTNKYRKNFPYSYLERVEFYKKNGMAEEAGRALKKYISLDPGSLMGKQAGSGLSIPAGKIVIIFDVSSRFGKIDKKHKEEYFYKVSVDGKYCGRSYPVEDMDLNKIKKRTARYVKNTLKNAARAAIIKNVFGKSSSSNIERRGWDKIPGFMHLFETRLPEGSHKIEMVLCRGDLSIDSTAAEVEVGGNVSFLFY